MVITYKKGLKQLASELRQQCTQSEAKLWEQLKGRKVAGHKFLRQKPIGDYIADFYCKELHLAIELDGLSHDSEEVMDKDAVKERYLNSLGIRVLRFPDGEVMNDMRIVLREIKFVIQERVSIYGKKIPPPLDG